MIPAALAVLAVCARAGDAPGPRFDKAVVVIFENTDFREAVKQPFFAGLAARGALLTDYHAIGHPSQPNYVALVSGDARGVKGDGVYEIAAPTLADLLEKSGRDWRLYAEGYPGRCFLKPRRGRYARKHVPLLSFTSVQKDAARCAKVVGASQFFQDFSSGTLKDFSLFVPDLKNDGHDTGVAYADEWLKKSFGPLLEKWPKGVLLVATFDEDSDSGGTNRIYTSFFGSMVAPGSKSDERYDHYGLLRTLEENWKLGDLGANDAKAKAIDGVWKK